MAYTAHGIARVRHDLAAKPTPNVRDYDPIVSPRFLPLLDNNLSLRRMHPRRSKGPSLQQKMTLCQSTEQQLPLGKAEAPRGAVWKALCSVAITKHHRLGGLTTEIYFLTDFTDESPRSGCQHVWGLVRAPFLSYREPPPCCVFTWCRQGASSDVSACKNTDHIMGTPST